jgi:hypothetical protein
MKTWKKFVWSKSRGFIALRISDLNFAGIKIGKPYEYSVIIPKQEQMIINFRKCKK